MPLKNADGAFFYYFNQALRRRLEKRIYIPLPCASARTQLLKINLKDVAIEEEVDLGKQSY